MVNKTRFYKHFGGHDARLNKKVLNTFITRLKRRYGFSQKKAMAWLRKYNKPGGKNPYGHGLLYSILSGASKTLRHGWRKKRHGKSHVRQIRYGPEGSKIPVINKAWSSKTGKRYRMGGRRGLLSKMMYQAHKQKHGKGRPHIYRRTSRSSFKRPTTPDQWFKRPTTPGHWAKNPENLFQ